MKVICRLNMDRLKNILAIVLIAIIVTNCNDILNKSAKDRVAVREFFNNAQDLKIAVNDLYTILPGANLYLDDTNSDIITKRGVSDRISGSRTVPTEKGSGGWSWNELRRINFVLENYDRVDDKYKDAKEEYSGIARFFRSYFYFEKVKRFGDVPWYNHVIGADDEALYKARDSRKMVMDSVLADINY